MQDQLFGVVRVEDRDGGQIGCLGLHGIRKMRKLRGVGGSEREMIRRVPNFEERDWGNEEKLLGTVEGENHTTRGTETSEGRGKDISSFVEEKSESIKR